jgi:hypothetical protein
MDAFLVIAATLAITAGVVGGVGILRLWWRNRVPPSQDRILATDRGLAGTPIGPRPRQRIGATGPTGPALSTSQPDATMALARAINRLAEAVERQRRFP